MKDALVRLLFFCAVVLAVAGFAVIALGAVLVLPLAWIIGEVEKHERRKP
jgi:hypothetical protein